MTRRNAAVGPTSSEHVSSRRGPVRRALCVAVVFLAVFLGGAGAPPESNEGVVAAQEGRYELGRRLRNFEIALTDQHSAESLQRATPYLNDAVRDFFSMRWNEAAAALDMARFSLIAAERPSRELRWAASLSVVPNTFLLDLESNEVGLTITPFYNVAGEIPKGLKIEVVLRDGEQKPVARVEFKPEAVPYRDLLPLGIRSEGDYALIAEAVVGTQRVVIAQHRLSLAQKLKPRLQALRDGLRLLPDKPRNTQRATLEDYVAALSTLAHGGQLETAVRAVQLLEESEKLLSAEQKNTQHFGRGRSGDFWLTLAQPTGNARVRLFAPEAARNGQPLPLVIALHGAGGSENMFFDAYGNGKITELCRRRGWLVVAPAATFFGLGLSAQKIIDEIDSLYPVDRTQVLVVGHSMGAGHAVRTAELLTTPPRAVAALGGGSRLRQPERLRSVAVFVAAGSEDFLLEQAKTLAAALRQAGADPVEFREYPNVEHLGIVQLALDDVFAFFDKQITASPAAAPTAARSNGSSVRN